MDFMQRIRAFFAKISYGSYGSDQLGRAVLYGSMFLLHRTRNEGSGSSLSAARNRHLLSCRSPAEAQ